MEKMDNDAINYNHNINIIDRKNLMISGVKKIENFDNEEFVIETSRGMLTIKGENLELIKLDTIQGNISIKGIINSMEYNEDDKAKEKQGIINRLFK